VRVCDAFLELDSATITAELRQASWFRLPGLRRRGGSRKEPGSGRGLFLTECAVWLRKLHCTMYITVLNITVILLLSDHTLVLLHRGP